VVILDNRQSKLRSLDRLAVFSRLAAYNTFKKWIICTNVEDLSRRKMATPRSIETDFLRKIVRISTTGNLA